MKKTILTLSLIAISCLAILQLSADGKKKKAIAFKEILIFKNIKTKNDLARSAIILFDKKHKQSIKELIAVLEDKNQENGRKLMAAETLGIMRAREAIKVLIKNIDLTPAIAISLVAEGNFPAIYALSQIGLPAVPALLKEFKKYNPKDKFLIRFYLFNALDIIYDHGGGGMPMLIARIKLEIIKTKNKTEKANLKASLKKIEKEFLHKIKNGD